MKQLSEYLETIQLNSQLKLFIQNRTEVEVASDEIYLNYPQLFTDSFTGVNQKKVDFLNISGYLYYKAVLLLDKLIDSKSAENKTETLFLISKLQEESIKHLTAVFGLNSNFWELWNIRQKEYFRAIQLENQLTVNPNYKKYQQVADLKAAFGKVAIDCLYVLSKDKNEKKYTDLLQSHHHFSVALQLIDDLQDLEEDILNKQFNWAYYQTVCLLKRENYDLDNLSISDIKKLIYLKDIAISIRKEALKQLQKSKQIALKHNPKKWISVIEKQEKEIIQAIDKINSYKQKIETEILLSKELLPSNEIAILNRIDFAKKFVADMQNTDGSWFDYNTNAGMSNVWVTAFILSNISDLNSGFDKQVIHKGCSFLINNKQNNLWGYNTSMIPDNDSTAFVLLALSKNKLLPSKELEIYLSQQAINGGYSTYIDKKSLSEYLHISPNEIQGWLQAHVCVSAVSYFLMETLKLNNSSKEKIINYLQNKQSNYGFWDSYWWTSPIYATSYVIQAHFTGNKHLSDSIKKASAALLIFQQEDGSFIDNYNVKSTFFTALSIIALNCSVKLYKKYQKEIDLAVSWLLSQQTTDGSFLPTYSLQIPEACVLDPKIVKEWFKSENKATNIIANDFRRLFTTSTCIKALDLYIKNDTK